ncbi:MULTISPECIES: FadR/GntR family transcriptional regulator [Photorhabdus]|uniref:FadR family transcriptional regulator n=3 Tax=Photorhabdus khanii TaxID=1004150 RepID=A0A4R4K308_9GAMM|nr:FadR/GntR family transcriptional regulator [Photorhabdus khanii]ETS31754.1 transcriptional regulator, GntR family [Photorhabdus khanii NC19]MQL50444.1 FCD domain-containing protein [Photorhabdus khanii]OHV50310.1 GntR family transcriptional regulator [Photorhabdus temperata]TDB60781.1 FadR family transcriptional regulator [Photorhabdus khanii subsp. guanajuatensis]
MQFKEQRKASQKNLSYLLAEKIGQQILSGEYKTETILPGEIELAEQFNVSRTSVREAIKILAAKGMLLPRPRIGTRIMPTMHWNFLDQDLLKWWMNRDNLNQVIEHFHIVRLAIEPQACFLAAKNATQEQKKQLLQLIDEMYLLKENFNREKWIDIDYQFHHTIYKSCGNPFLGSFANLFRPVYQNYFEAIISDKVVQLEDHKTIVDSIIKGDSRRALLACQKLLTEHE